MSFEEETVNDYLLSIFYVLAIDRAENKQRQFLFYAAHILEQGDWQQESKRFWDTKITVTLCADFSQPSSQTIKTNNKNNTTQTP